MSTDSPGTLRGPHWRFPNGSCVPGANGGQAANSAVHMELFTGSSSAVVNGRRTMEWEGTYL